MKVIALLFCTLALCYANPMPQGQAGAEVKQQHGQTPTLNVFGSQGWKSDNGRGAAEVSGNHMRELGGQGRHQTNAGVAGSYDVFRSDSGRTTGTVFGSHQQTWNSHGAGNSRATEYGGRVTHTWGK